MYSSKTRQFVKSDIKSIKDCKMVVKNNYENYMGGSNEKCIENIDWRRNMRTSHTNRDKLEPT